jgi:hypothetical protein
MTVVVRTALNRRSVRRRRLGHVQASSAVLAYEAPQDRLGALRAPVAGPPMMLGQALGPGIQRTLNRRPVGRQVVPLLFGGSSPPTAKSTHPRGIGHGCSAAHRYTTTRGLGRKALTAR